MKKITILSLSLIAGLNVNAQEFNRGTEPLVKQSNELNPKVSNYTSSNLKSKTSAVIWSEDFGGGIPSTWTNQCLDELGNSLNGNWEYRGPNTTPDNTFGSRGAFGNDTVVVNSATRANGFVLFDSDYLDNGGTAGGTGTAQAPHYGILTTDTIDLTGYSDIEIEMTAYYRKYASSMIIALSKDGGVTFPDSVELYSYLNLNDASERAAVDYANISMVGNEPNVILKFIFDGTDEGAPGSFGYYVFQMDDIVIQELPKFRAEFTDENGAPANDMLTDGHKNGHIPLSQAKPIVFDSNIKNTGSESITNLRLRVNIRNSAGMIIDSLDSPAVASLAPDSIADWSLLTTNAWTPTAVESYTMEYTFEMDSALTSGSIPVESYNLFIGGPGGNPSEKSGMDHGVLDNVTGNPSIGDDDGGAYGGFVSYPNPQPGKSTISIYGCETYFSTRTVAGGDIEVQLYDTTGFDPLNGFASAPLINRSFTVDTSWVGETVQIDLTNNGTPVEINPGSYYLVMYFYSNGGANDIYIANDQSFESLVYRSILYSTSAGRWYSGYIDSRSFDQIWLRALSDASIGIEEDVEINDLNVYPNPSEGDINIEISKGGDYSLQLIDMTGKVIDKQLSTYNSNERVNLNYDHLPKGVYLLTVNGEGQTKTARVILK